MKILQLSILFITISALSACSSSNVIAKNTNLFQTAGNIHSSGFNRRLNWNSLNSVGSHNALYNVRNNRRGLQNHLSQQYAVFEQQNILLAEIETANNRLKIKINQLKENTTAQRAKKSHALKQINRLQRNTKILRISMKKHSISKNKFVINKSIVNSYKTQLTNLDQEIKALRKFLMSK